MLGFLSTIADAVSSAGQLVLWALMTAINAVIAGLGNGARALLLLLPSLPDPPTPGAGSWIGWLNWVFPLAPALSAATGLLLLYVFVLALRIALRWVKAL